MALLVACAPLTPSDVEDRVRVVEDVVYVAGSDHDKHRLDLYLPKGVEGFPVVHFVHGGYWAAGDRDYYELFTGLYGTIGLALARNGVGVAVQSYRLSPEVTIEGILEDVTRAVRWTVDHAAEHGGDPERLVLMGHSAGGHLVSLLATDAAQLEAVGLSLANVRGVVALSPVLDLVDMRDNSEPDFNAEVTTPVFGDDARLVRFSPRTHFTPDMPRLRLVVGSQDYPSLREQAHRAADELRALGCDVDLHELEGYSHSDLVVRVGEDDDQVTPLALELVREVTRDE